MRKHLEELKYQVPMKDTTEPGDVVVILREIGEKGGRRIEHYYARVTGFERDPSKRDEWWFVSLVNLTLPPIPQTLILQTPHFTGQEIFTMGGKEVFIKAIDFSFFSKPADSEPQKEPSDGGEKNEQGKRPVFKILT